MPDEQPWTVLHDNLTDPDQLVNIAAERPDIVARLVEEELNPWLERTNDPWRESP